MAESSLIQQGEERDYTLRSSHLLRNPLNLLYVNIATEAVTSAAFFTVTNEVVKYFFSGTTLQSHGTDRGLLLNHIKQ